MESGAGATVADGSIEFPEYDLEDSPGSLAGQHYVGPGSQRIPNRRERNVKLRLGSADGRLSAIKFQDAKVRRPICSVGETTGVGNMVIFDKEESVYLPKGSPEIAMIRELVRSAKGKLTMQKEKNTFYLPAWIEKKAPFQGRGK